MQASSFQDVTNTLPTKRRVSPQYIPQGAPTSNAINLNTVQELSEKIDNVSRKVDAIYELLISLFPQQVYDMPWSADPIQQMPCVGMMNTAVPYEENSNVVSLFNDALHKKQVPVSSIETPVYMPQPNIIISATTPTTTTTPTITSTETVSENILTNKEREPKTHDSKKLSSPTILNTTTTRNNEPFNWPKRDCFILLVEFKCQRVKRCESNIFITPGQYAIVQGDRGHDCGVVNQCSEWSAEQNCFTREESFDGVLVNVSRMKNDMGRVLRVATEEEVEKLFGEIARNENLALKTCREIVSRLALDMDVVDCEYQFDQQKISFYYEAARSIDFRQLNSELFRVFGVRIWLQNVNNAVKNVVPAGAMSRDDKVQYQKSGLRPPNFK